MDEPQELLAQVDGRHEDASPAILLAVTRQQVEQLRHVVAHVLAARHQPQVGVDAGSLLVVVAGAHVHIMAQTIGLLA